MTRSIRSPRLLLAAVVAIVAAWPLAQLAYAGPEPLPDVPSKIAVEEGHKVFLVGHAIGVQIYVCNPVGTAYRWDFVAPRADLYDDNGKLLTTHFAGPTWQAKDGSYVIGRRVDGVTMDTSAIPWLLLAVDDGKAVAGPDGDRLVPTTFIQRLNTTGGIAPPAATCSAESLGDVEEVDYTADYYFWKRATA